MSSEEPWSCRRSELLERHCTPLDGDFGTLEDAKDTGNCLSFSLEFEFVLNWKVEELLRNENLKPTIPVFTPEWEATQVPGFTQRVGAKDAPEVRGDYPMHFMKEFFREKGFWLKDEVPTGNMAPKPFPQMFLFPHTGWEVSNDCTVCDNGSSGYQHPVMFPHYGWYGFEIKTPVLKHCQDSFDHIREVLSAINKSFRTRVNPTTGMHCHVGNGTQLVLDKTGRVVVLNDTQRAAFNSRTFSLRDLRRISALLWSADPFLATLHPPERQVNPYALSIRQHSGLAKDEAHKLTKKFDTPPGPERDLDKPPSRPINRMSSERFPAIRPRKPSADAIARGTG
ncbi:hypothetical protein B0T14DRAFT_559671 [Immersiella caudata]|uniref:Uncharacterized protein n=1 Tax=Immersiella caudata TaxID=314043 RepID=A0AA39XE17_9PEZI|nr:hypothetical protein B0T14DRAFT_559671 [Immersiella caudata]